MFLYNEKIFKRVFTHSGKHWYKNIKAIPLYITYHIWEKYSAYLSKCFWKERTFFSDGYFISSIGNVSQETLKNYIENQGK